MKFASLIVSVTLLLIALWLLFFDKGDSSVSSVAESGSSRTVQSSSGPPRESPADSSVASDPSLGDSSMDNTLAEMDAGTPVRSTMSVANGIVIREKMRGVVLGCAAKHQVELPRYFEARCRADITDKVTTIRNLQLKLPKSLGNEPFEACLVQDAKDVIFDLDDRDRTGQLVTAVVRLSNSHESND